MVRTTVKVSVAHHHLTTSPPHHRTRYIVASGAFGGALHFWSNHTLGFLGGSLSLPHVDWLPWLGSNGSGFGEGAPLGRLLMALVLLAVGALMIPALIWSQKKPAVVATGLTIHAFGLAGKERGRGGRGVRGVRGLGARPSYLTTVPPNH